MHRFEQSFDRSINQSTVSRSLGKFNEDPDLLLVAESTGKSTKRKPRPRITRTDVNQALDVLQLYIIQTTPSTATPQSTASLMDSITTLTNQMWELNMNRKQQSHLEKWLKKSEGGLDSRMVDKDSGYHVSSAISVVFSLPA